jgi:hypothetical protein
MHNAQATRQYFNAFNARPLCQLEHGRMFFIVISSSGARTRQTTGKSKGTPAHAMALCIKFKEIPSMLAMHLRCGPLKHGEMF